MISNSSFATCCAGAKTTSTSLFRTGAERSSLQVHQHFNTRGRFNLTLDIGLIFDNSIGIPSSHQVVVCHQ